MGTEIKVRYNAVYGGTAEAAVVARGLRHRLKRKSLFSLEKVEILTEEASDLSQDMVLAAEVKRHTSRVGTTAQYIADHLGEWVDDILDGNLQKKQATLSVRLGRQKGEWKRTV